METVTSRERTLARGTAAGPSIPPVVKRNTLLVASSQVCTGMGTGLQFLGPLMVYQMLGSAALAGSPAVIQGISRFLVAYPVGVMADRYGRKPVIVAGLLIAGIAAPVIGTSVAVGSFPLLMCGILVFAAAASAVQQLRVAAIDMYPPSRRAEGLGYVLTASVAGSIGQAGLITLASAVAVSLTLDPMALSWWLVPAILFPALLLVLQIHPDPRDIARNLDDYYPVQQTGSPVLPGPPSDRQAGNFRAYLKDFTKLTVFVSMFGVHGNMFMAMVVTALTLADHGHGLPAIGVSSTLHALGMFAFTIPQGWVSDRYGRRPVMLAGLPLAALGTALIGLTGDYWVVTLGYFLVGFGWSAVNVAGTALLADVSHPSERARVIGGNDTFAGAANILLALFAGPALGLAGMPAIVAMGVALMIAPLVMILRLGRTRGAPELGKRSPQP